MHPLIVTPLYPPAVGGAATYFRELTANLAQRAEIDQITILTERMPNAATYQTAGKVQVMRLLPHRVSAREHSRIRHSTRYLTTQLWFWRHLSAFVGQHGVDVLHFHTRFRGRFFYAALKKCRVPVVADMRDQMTSPAHLTPFTDWLLCCGEGVQTFAAHSGFPTEKTTLIPNAFTPQPPPSAAQSAAVRGRFGLSDVSYLLYVGEITPNKGIYELLTAFRQWRLAHPDIWLVLAGTNREGQRFMEEVGKMAAVQYLNAIEHTDVLGLMRDAQIVILPSRSEGMPTVILEAISLGAKVICPPHIPEFDRYLPDFVLPAVTPESICAMLEQVWRTPEPPAYPLATHHIDRVVDALVSGYAKILRRTAATASNGNRLQ